MSKEVTYSVVARKNMLKKDDPAKYYAQAQASGDVGLDEISTRVEKACTVHSADVVAVLKALEDEMVDGLSRGEIVRLGNIGTFQVGLRSRGAEKAEDFKAANISKARVNFRPGPVLADAMKTLNFSKVSTRAAQKGDGGGDGSRGSASFRVAREKFSASHSAPSMPPFFSSAFLASAGSLSNFFLFMAMVNSENPNGEFVVT